MIKTFTDYFRPVDRCFDVAVHGEATGEPGYFRLGPGNLCFGRTSPGRAQRTPNGAVYDALAEVRVEDGRCSLPFDLTEVVENLRQERYVRAQVGPDSAGLLRSLVRHAYYFIRPALPVRVRRHLQRASLRHWDRKPFPSWPVDRTVDGLLEKLMQLAIEARGNEPIPFIWFWPEGKSACAMMTHDVETRSGLEFCRELMDMDDSYGIKSSFQLIPGGRYSVVGQHISEIRARGFEVNVHDWNHDGRLFSDHECFLKRAAKIKAFAARYAIGGFRSGALYRNIDWCDTLQFEYDMSVPNCGHLDPQSGGCCTLMPYFIGRTLEIPVTTIQDYSLFHILRDYSTQVWRRQLDQIVGHNGLASFIVHPDYIIDEKARTTYAELLGILAALGARDNVWLAKPADVNRWWRDRSQMRLANSDGEWHIEGPGKERARIAYAVMSDEGLRYRLAGASGSMAVGKSPTNGFLRPAELSEAFATWPN